MGPLLKLENKLFDNSNVGFVITLVALPLIYIKKKHFKAKEELWKLKYFTIAKIYLIFKTIL